MFYNIQISHKDGLIPPKKTRLNIDNQQAQYYVMNIAILHKDN